MTWSRSMSAIIWPILQGSLYWSATWSRTRFVTACSIPRARSNGQKDVFQRCHVNDDRHQTDYDRRRDGLDDAPQSGHLERRPVISGRRRRYIGHISYLNCFHARFSFHGRMRKTAGNSIIRRQSAEIARSGWGAPLTGASQMRRLSRNDR
jgi:hypothetical protein